MAERCNHPLALIGLAAVCALFSACALGAPEPPPAHENAAGAPGEEGTFRLTVQESILLALERNRALRVERLTPLIQRTYEGEERSAFDPTLSAEAAAEQEKAETPAGVDTRTKTTALGVGVSERLPTGTEIDVGLATERTWGTTQREQHVTRGGLTITQALLRGVGLGVNLADLRQARLDTQFSEYELRGFAEALVAQVENTYWDCFLARRQVEIVEESLKLAEQQLHETQQRIRVGDLAETELAAAQAEVALRKEALINARSRVATLQVRLLRLVNPAALTASARDVIPLSKPNPPASELDPLDEHRDLAFQMRPDMNQARLLIQRGDLEIVKTRNGLLPRMDLFITLGKTGYARSFGGSVNDIASDGYDVSAGVALELPLTNRGERARHRRATLSRRQYEESLRNLMDLVREDLESAYIEVQRARQQVAATTATRRFQQEKLRAETAKFRVGKSTAILVAGAQRDLVVSQVAEVGAATNYLQAMTSLYLLDGSLLERRGIAAPGRQSVRPQAWDTATPEPSPDWGAP